MLELVEGSTLQARISGGRISDDEALSIASQIAEGLEAAHDRGIIHSDLKPANIKLRPDGTVKILDFGLARMLDVADVNSNASGPAAIPGTALSHLNVVLNWEEQLKLPGGAAGAPER